MGFFCLSNFKKIKTPDLPVRGSSFTFPPGDPARVGGSRATEEMNRKTQHDGNPRMSDRDRGRKRERKRERERRDGRS